MKALFLGAPRRIGFHRAVLILGLALGGCSPPKDNAPPSEQIRDSLSAALPPYLAVTGVESEAIAIGPDQVKVNAKVTVSPRETLYVSDRRIVGDPSLLLVKPMQVAGGKVTLYGSMQAQRTEIAPVS